MWPFRPGDFCHKPIPMPPRSGPLRLNLCADASDTANPTTREQSRRRGRWPLDGSRSHLEKGSVVREPPVSRRRTAGAAGRDPRCVAEAGDLLGDHPLHGAGQPCPDSWPTLAPSLLAFAWPAAPVHSVPANGARAAKPGQRSVLVIGAPVYTRSWRGNTANTCASSSGPDRGGRPAANSAAAPTSFQSLQKVTPAAQA